MDAVLKIDPGLIIWTIINFVIFLLIVLKIGVKPIANSLKSREKGIQDSIDAANQANENATKMLAEADAKLKNSQQEMNDIIRKGREQAELILQKAGEEADVLRKQKVAEAQRDIELSKDNALKQLRTEVADLVIKATEKILDQELDKDKHSKLIETAIKEMPTN